MIGFRLLSIESYGVCPSEHGIKYFSSVKVELSKDKLFKRHPATCCFNVETSFDALRAELKAGRAPRQYHEAT
jgi:hypothetical protein